MVYTQEKSEAERKAALHAQIDAMHATVDIMDDPEIEPARRALLMAEAEMLIAKIAEGFDQARRDGRMTDETIQVAIAEHRVKHPYR